MRLAKFFGPTAGVLAPPSCGAAVIAGAASFAGCSHPHDPISALTQSGRTGVMAINLWIFVAAVDGWPRPRPSSLAGRCRHTYNLAQ